MLALKYILMVAAVSSIAATLIMAGYQLWLVIQFRRNLARAPEGAATLGFEPGRPEPGPVRWRLFAGMIVIGCVSLLIANSITVVPSGMGSVRVSQTRGTLPGTGGTAANVRSARQVVYYRDGRGWRQGQRDIAA
jgi:hypothetical protein